MQHATSIIALADVFGRTPDEIILTLAQLGFRAIVSSDGRQIVGPHAVEALREHMAANQPSEPPAIATAAGRGENATHRCRVVAQNHAQFFMNKPTDA